MSDTEEEQGLEARQKAVPVTTVVQHEKLFSIYRDEARKAYFSECRKETRSGPNGMFWIEYYIPRLRWDATTALQLLEGMSIQGVLGEGFALFAGKHSPPEDPVPRVEDALLVQIATTSEGRSLRETMGALFVASRASC